MFAVKDVVVQAAHVWGGGSTRRGGGRKAAFLYFTPLFPDTFQSFSPVMEHLTLAVVVAARLANDVEHLTT